MVPGEKKKKKKHSLSQPLREGEKKGGGGKSGRPFLSLYDLTLCVKVKPGEKKEGKKGEGLLIPSIIIGGGRRERGGNTNVPPGDLAYQGREGKKGRGDFFPPTRKRKRGKRFRLFSLSQKRVGHRGRRIKWADASPLTGRGAASPTRFPFSDTVRGGGEEKEE